VISEKYIPNESEFVGNIDAVKKLEGCINKRTPCILYGAPGIGKTSSVYMLAKKLGYEVIEVNASDERSEKELLDILRRVRMRSFVPIIYLFDEIDGIKNSKVFEDIIGNTHHPIVSVANELWRVPSRISEKCEGIRFYAPNIRQVLDRAKSIAQTEGVESAKYDNVSTDVRNSIISSIYGGEGYDTIDNFSTVESILKGKDIKDEDVMRDIGIWLLDNIPKFYFGKDLFDAYETLRVYGLIRNNGVLKCLKQGSGGKVSYPRYYKRKKAFQGGGVGDGVY